MSPQEFVSWFMQRVDGNDWLLHNRPRLPALPRVDTAVKDVAQFDSVLHAKALADMFFAQISEIAAKANQRSVWKMFVGNRDWLEHTLARAVEHGAYKGAYGEWTPLWEENADLYAPPVQEESWPAGCDDLDEAWWHAVPLSSPRRARSDIHLRRLSAWPLDQVYTQMLMMIRSFLTPGPDLELVEEVRREFLRYGGRLSAAEWLGLADFFVASCRRRSQSGSEAVEAIHGWLQLRDVRSIQRADPLRLGRRRYGGDPYMHVGQIPVGHPGLVELETHAGYCAEDEDDAPGDWS